MGTLIVGAAFLAAVVFVIVGMVKDKKVGKSVICGGECKHCGGACNYNRK